MTNNHVVRGARAHVSFNDGRHAKPIPGTVIGTAAERDLAIIRVARTDLIPVPLGRSSKLRLGDGVLAIGFPLGLTGGPTVTQGIVSGLDRTIQPKVARPSKASSRPTRRSTRATRAARSSTQGKADRHQYGGRETGSAENIGFAIAIDDARPVIDEIRTKPAGQRAWLGATFDTIDSAAPRSSSASRPIRVGPPRRRLRREPGLEGGPAGGRLVVAIGGRPVRSAEAMSKALRAINPGDSVVLDVLDRSGPRRVTVTAGKRP